MGHALEFVQADVLARAWRFKGDEVFFSTGTDEHGQKILEAAEKASAISADELERAEKELEKITHEHVDLIDKAFGRKEQELLEV